MKETKLTKQTPWAFLDAWRGTAFNGEWPTLPEMFRISVERFGDRPCLTMFEPDRISLTYRETLEKVEKLAAWLHSSGVRKGDHVGHGAEPLTRTGCVCAIPEESPKRPYMANRVTQSH